MDLVTADSVRSALRPPTLSEACLSVLLRSLPIKHGAHRILDKVKPVKWPRDSTVVRFPYKGYTIQMEISDLVGWHFFILRSFDPEVTDVIKKFSSGGDDDVFWDIGANRGACSYEIATALPRSKVIAIEPQQALTPLLERNLDVLAKGRFKILPMGIGETPGCFELTIPDGNQGRASLVQQKTSETSQVEVIEVITAETASRQTGYGWPTLIKIDVEGFETSVISSLKTAFECRSVRCCVFECHSSEAAGFEAIRATTEKFGYRVYAICKTAFSTTLAATESLRPGSTDYAIVRDDLFQ